eukprot:scaffold345800_cov22-Prasinocladus_malaysianus.AAC.1
MRQEGFPDMLCGFCNQCGGDNHRGVGRHGCHGRPRDAPDGHQRDRQLVEHRSGQSGQGRHHPGPGRP